MPKTIFFIVALFALLSSGLAMAETKPKHPPTPQQNRMKMCAVQYHEKKIPKHEYRAFMKQCLRTHPAKPKAVIPGQ